MMNEIDRKECKSAIFELWEDYLYVKYKDDSTVDLEEAENQSNLVRDLCKGKKMPFVVDFIDVNVRIDDEARQYFANVGPHIQVRKAQAILVNSLQSKLLTRFYIKFHKPENPTKMFDNLQDALDWIKTI